jgi:DNA helicase-2/ATP-dependent DNA helicase PcrA
MRVLTDEQIKFLSVEGNVVLSACPGSGKTYVVAKKLLKYIENWELPHQGVALLSFTNVASQEVERQVTDIAKPGLTLAYPHFIGTIDSFINNYILLRFGYLIMNGRRPSITTNNIAGKYNYWNAQCYKNGCVSRFQEFRWGMDGRLYRKSESVACEVSGLPCLRYKKHLRKMGVVSQNEAAALAYILLKKHPNIAKGVARRFPIIVLDEAQDTSVEQMALLDAINDAGLKSLILVGDPDQSIYEWRDATPECFLRKEKSKNWATLRLTKNFRNSQLICNAAAAFAHSLVDKPPNLGVGSSSQDPQKPVLLIYDGQLKDCRETIISKFLEYSDRLGIPADVNSRAVVTRGRIHEGTDIRDLWKSSEVEWLAQASYQWDFGARRRAYQFCETALFSMVVEEQVTIEPKTDHDLEALMTYEEWRFWIIFLLGKLPSAREPLYEWVTKTQTVLSEELESLDLSVRDSYSLRDIINIKTRDKSFPHFRKLPLKNFFEKKKHEEYTLSSVHGVKGETYDSLMLIVENKTGKTLTPKFLNEGDLNEELMRIAYVALTRPRRLLMVAMPKVKSRKEFQRFPIDKWDYLYID